MLSNIGIPGLILILVALLIFFGPSKLPEIGKAFGKGLREFKDATRGMMEDADKPAKGAGESTTAQATVQPIELAAVDKVEATQPAAETETVQK